MPGLFLIAFAHLSFLSLPEVADILTVLMVVSLKVLMPFYVSATLGLAGCLIGGSRPREAKFVRKRFGG